MENKEILITREQIKQAIGLLPPAGSFGEEMFSNQERSVIVSRNVTGKNMATKAELHENYFDLFFVQAGEEEILIGGEILDKQQTKPGEWRGEKLTGARAYKLKAGDIIIIPKGVAHRHGVGVIKMIVIKIRG